jgi:tetratricopeptide (TPR) repeat protein
MGREPSEPSHVEQFRRALVLLGEDDPDRIIAERLSAAPEYPSADDDMFPVSFEEETAPADPVIMPADEPAPGAPVTTIADESALPDADGSAPAPGPARKRPADVPASMEIDLSDVLADFNTPEASPAEPAGIDAAPRRKADIDQFRKDASHGSKHDAARAAYDRAVALRDAGFLEESLPGFEAASREPRLRFHAAAALGRLYRQRDEFDRAIEWFEQASQAPAPTPDEAYSLFLELAEALESFGMVDRALATCRELQAEAGDYRDVAARISRLAKAQSRG